MLSIMEAPFKKFRNIPVNMNVRLQGLQGITLKFRGIKGNIAKEGNIKGNMCKHRSIQTVHF